MKRSFLFLFAGAVVLFGPAVGVADAHDERASQFPSGKGSVPQHRAASQAAAVLVVCKPESAAAISSMSNLALRNWNQQLLSLCRYNHLQAAVDAVRVKRTNIYVLPGTYREEPSWNPPCVSQYSGGIVPYELIVGCGEVVSLVTIAGDDPADPDITCDNALCELQIEGTGARPEDVVFTGGFGSDGRWIKHTVLKADRADGFYLKNMTFQFALENGVYIHETDGYAVDRVVSRSNDYYGVLTFASDHGLITDCEAHHNGDSGVYPGSAADVNAASTQTGPLQRWAVEIRRCRLHHNATGLSGAAGNSIWFHDNDVHHNTTGMLLDSHVSGHPGMPQDHAWIERNRIYSNNENYYPNVNGAGAPCQASRPADRGLERGVVCPAIPLPIGTGILMAGGNHNLVRDNLIYDNWRSGATLFWIPAAIRGDLRVEAQTDTSHGNHFKGNKMGLDAAGAVKPNGLDVSWDGQGRGNCWEANSAPTGRPTSDWLLGLPDCSSGGSSLVVGNVATPASLLPCTSYNRYSQPSPPGCPWLTPPQRPGSGLGLFGLASVTGVEDTTMMLATAGLVGWLVALSAIGAVGSAGVAAGFLRQAALSPAFERRPSTARRSISSRRKPVGKTAGRVAVHLVAAAALAALAHQHMPAAPDTGQVPGARPSEGDAVAGQMLVPAFGERGTRFLLYRHNGSAFLTLPVTNHSSQPLRIHGAALEKTRMPLFALENVTSGGKPLPVTIEPGQTAHLELHGRFGNCRYHHEREVEVVRGALVEAEVHGSRSTRFAAFDSPALIPSPMIVFCPDRTLDRSDDYGSGPVRPMSPKGSGGPAGSSSGRPA